MMLRRVRAGLPLCAVLLLCAAGTAPGNDEQPASPASADTTTKPEPWGNFLFVIGYGEIEPNSHLADPVRYPETLRIISRMGVDAVKVDGICADPRSRARFYGGASEPWRSYFQRVWREQTGKSVVPSTGLFCVGNDCMVRNHEGSILYTYADPVVKQHTTESIIAMANLFRSDILRIGGRPVVDWEREHGYSYAPLAGAQDPPSLDAFRAWLRGYYTDGAPCTDTNGDGRTFNAECGTTDAAWETVKPLPAENNGIFAAPTARDRVTHPMLWWLWSRFKNDLCAGWEAGHIAATDTIRFIPIARYIGQCGVHPGQPIVIGNDYYARRDPSKVVVGDVSLGWGRPIDQPWAWDRAFGTAWASTSRMRGASYLWFDPPCWTQMPQWGDNNFFGIGPKYEPIAMETQSWWAHTIEAQHWLFGDALTPQPQVAYYEDRTFLPVPAVGIQQALAQRGIACHNLDDRPILDGALEDYRVLIVAARRVPREVLDRIRAFADSGGYVLAIGPSLRWDMAGKRTDAFEAIMGLEAGPSFLASKRNEGDDLPAGDLQAADLAPSPVEGRFAVDSRHACLPYDAGTKLPLTWYHPRIDTVEGGEVLARYQGKPCVALGRNRRTMFYGGEITPSDFDGALPIAFAEHAGVKPFVTVTTNGILDTANRHSVTNMVLEKGCRENKALRARMFVFSNTTAKEAKSEIDFEVDGPGLVAWEVRTQTLIKPCVGRVQLTVPAEQTRLLLVAPEAVVDRYRTIQERVDAESRLFDFHCSRHFFFKKPMLFQGDAGAQYYAHTAGTPNCIFVLGEKPADGDRAFAERLRKTIADWPVASNRIEIPIKAASELSDADYASNLLLFGGPEENSATRRLCDRGALSLAGNREPVVSRHETPWYSGGNVLVLQGRDREKAYRKLWDWLRVWFDSPGHYEPGPYDGWPKARGSLTIEKQDVQDVDREGRRIDVLVRASQDTDLRLWPLLMKATLDGQPVPFEWKIEPTLRHPLNAADPIRASVGDIGVRVQWKNYSQDPTPFPAPNWTRGNILAYQEHLGGGEQLLLEVSLIGAKEKLKGEHRIGVSFDGIPVEMRVKCE